jgi:hypothetical protein
MQYANGLRRKAAVSDMLTMRSAEMAAKKGAPV